MAIIKPRLPKVLPKKTILPKKPVSILPAPKTVARSNTKPFIPNVRQITDYLSQYRASNPAGAAPPTMGPGNTRAPQSAAPSMEVTYTPNGIARAPGYFDHNNPFDTGRAGERNSEHGGGKNTMSGWDYERGAPKPGAVRASDGLWTLGGSSGGSSGGAAGGASGEGGIPGASVIAQGAAQGLAEYKRALARLNQNRLGTLTESGYTGEIDPETGVLKNMRVDSSNPYGTYQKMRYGNARDSDALRDASMERGIGSKGLGAQSRAAARFAWGAADTAMAQGLSRTLSGFDEQQQGAWQQYQNLLWQLEMEAMRAAAESGDYGGWDGGGEGEADVFGDPLDAGGLGDPFAPLGNASAAQLAKAIALGAKKTTPVKKAAPMVKVSAKAAPSKGVTPAKAAAINKAVAKAAAPAPKPKKKK